MKFLIISRMRDLFVTLPIEDQDHIVEGLASFVDKYRKAGTLEEIYSIPSIKGTVSIWEVESPEKVGIIFLENPASVYQDYDMYVLSDFDAYIKALEGIYEKVLVKR